MKPELLLDTCSKHFNATQLEGILKLGDVVIPGDKHLPKFSETEFILDIDRMLDFMEEEDLNGLKILMTIFNYCPRIFIHAILKLSEYHNSFPTFIASVLRTLKLGLKGIIFTLYYSGLEDQEKYGQLILKTIGWDARTPSYQPRGEIMSENYKLTPTQIFSFSKQASKEIKELTIEQRLKYVSALKKLILREKEIIIERIQDDTKKSRSDALISEIFGVLDHLSFLEKESKNALADEKIKTPIALLGKKSRIFYQPLGTILIISPWNYPFYQAIVPIMAAFVSGNASIYKPSEFTPLTGLVEELMAQIGMREHWVQVVYGDGQIASQLIDERPDKIFFTGSVATGKKIMQQASHQLIPVELELGGKDPSIVFSDANIKRAANGVVWGALTNCGQSCTSVERVYVQETCLDEFVAEVKAIVSELKQSRDYDGDSDFGGMTTSNQVKIVKDHLDDALSKGANLICGQEWDGTNEMIPALVLTNVTEDMLIAHEETFGPIIPIMSFNDENEVISRANNSPYGLSASVWSHDLKRCDRIARNLDVGNVSINNVMLTEGNHYLPFGGQKNSGIGRYKGVHGLRSFCNMKSILIDSDSKKIEANWFPYTKKKYQLFSKMTDGAFSGGILNFIKFAIFGTLTEGLSQKRRSQIK